VSNWNAYKIFKNGKRAKAPFTTFEAEEKEFFFSDVLPTLDEKMQKAEWVVISTDVSQERPLEIRNEKQEGISKKRNQLLSKMAAQKFPSVKESSAITCLMFNENTDWKWTWCVAEGGSHKFIGCLSEKFETRKEAIEWIENQAGTQHTSPEI
jgi:hypothetical protein